MAKIKEKDAMIYQNPNPTFLYGNVSQSPSMNASVTSPKTTVYPAPTVTTENVEGV